MAQFRMDGKDLPTTYEADRQTAQTLKLRTNRQVFQCYMITPAHPTEVMEIKCGQSTVVFRGPSTYHRHHGVVVLSFDLLSTHDRIGLGLGVLGQKSKEAAFVWIDGPRQCMY
jgi:hypothetical protein